MIQNRYFRYLISACSFIWFIFLIFHLFLKGEISLWNFFGNIPTFLFPLIPLVILSVKLLVKEKKRIVLSILFISFLLGLTQLDANFTQATMQEIDKKHYTRIKVFNWNTWCWDQKKNKDSFYRFLKEQHADIYILQEYLYFSLDWKSKNIDRNKLFPICTTIPGFQLDYLAIDVRDRIKKEFPGYYITIHQQFVTLSKFPIVHSHLDRSDQYSVNDIDINGRIVRFFNVHGLLHVEPTNPLQPYFYQALALRFKARELFFNNLKKDLRNTDKDYIVTGDFNASKFMNQIQYLLKDHIDAEIYSDEFLPLTFEFEGFRLWRFDYFMYRKKSNTIQVESFMNLNHEGLSDHKPQSVIVYIKKKLKKNI